MANRFIVFLLLLGLGGCDHRSIHNELDRHVEVCSVAERNGILDSAVEACGTALAIAEEQEYAPDLISALAYRLGRLERQRGRFAEAGALVKHSLELEERAGHQGATAVRLIELSLTEAGQGHWTGGAELLERALPLTDALTSQDRQDASNVFRAFGVRLAGMGHPEQAEQFKRKAEDLANR